MKPRVDWRLCNPIWGEGSGWGVQEGGGNLPHPSPQTPLPILPEHLSDTMEDLTVEKWHSKKIEQVADELETRLEMGLSKAVASSRLREFGPNELMEKKGRTLAVMLFDQFKDVLILILIAAVLISGALGEFLDAAAI